jgi:glycosyltransferase involved in cell wall biosynthesis
VSAPRVLYSFPDTLGKPGIGTTALEQVRSLARLGLDVHVAATSLAEDPGVPCTLTMSPAGRRVPHRALGRDRAGSLRAYAWHDRRVAGLLRRRGASFDVVHCWPQATLQTARSARAQNLPVLRQAPSTHTAHAIATVGQVHEALGLPLRRDDVHGHSAKLVAREMKEYAAVDRVLVPSEHAARTFVERGVPAERIALHRFGCDLGRFAPQPDSGDERPLTVLFAGRGEPAKGLHLALRAWSDSGIGTDARLVICGEIEPRFREYLGDLLAQSGLEERGFSSDLAPLMRGSDVLLAPSLNEGSALVTYEAQASGCVPAVSDSSGAYAEHMVHGLIHEAGDVATLTEHLGLLARDRALLARLRARSLADRDRLSWDAAARGLADVYSQALRPREARPVAA